MSDPPIPHRGHDLSVAYTFGLTEGCDKSIELLTTCLEISTIGLSYSDIVGVIQHHSLMAQWGFCVLLSR